MTTLTKAQEKAIDAVLDYAAHDEAEHYAGDGGKDHILNSLFVLAKMRGWEAKSLVAFQAEVLGMTARELRDVFAEEARP